MADFSTILLNTIHPDQRIRNEAANYLQEAKAQNLGMYLTALTAELVDEAKNPAARQAAGLTLKNELTSQNEVKRQQYAQEWLKLDAGIRENIKNGILHTLGSPLVFVTAAQVCGAIAQIELPHNMWPQLFDILLQNTNSTNPHLKKGTLQTLGFICEELDPSEPTVADKTNGILTAIVQSLREEETNFEVKYAAAKALENALEFARENFKRQVERDYIMTMVCSAVCSPDEKVKVAGFECLVKIASLYYEHLPSYMQSLFNLTLESIQKGTQAVALQAIEFWSTICDVEIELLNEIEDFQANQIPPTVVCHNFIKGALQYLVPLILETLTKQDEDSDGEWDVAMAGATCLPLIANCVTNEILNTVHPFVAQNINSTEWRLREAASMAFGSILEGVSDINAVIQQAVPYLVKHMQSDSHALVKDTAAWTIGRICLYHPNAIQGEILNYIMVPLLAALKDTPRVAANVCWALNNIAESFRSDDTKPAENFKPYFENSVLGLLNAAEREDADENNLKASAYEAINEFIESAETDECLAVIKQLVPVFQTRLDKTFQAQILTQDDRDQVADTQGLLCSLLHTCTKKLDEEIAPFADNCVGLYMRVFNTKSVIVHEEAFMAVGALANALKGGFEKYMIHFHQFLLLGLKSPEEYQVCTIVVGVIGDICRALQKAVTPYCLEFISILIPHLQNPHLDKSVKPPILSCFGDIALAICGEFQKYLGSVMNILFQAAQYQVDKNYDELVEYQNELREGIFEAFTGILQGLRTDDQADQFLPFVDNVVMFIAEVVFKDQTRTDEVTRAAIGVIGDLAQTLGSKVKAVVAQDSVKIIVNQYLNSENESISEVAAYAQEKLAKL